MREVIAQLVNQVPSPDLAELMLGRLQGRTLASLARKQGIAVATAHQRLRNAVCALRALDLDGSSGG
jgi:DNA-directed RNA polymerase specialized sigma24 family protein